MAVGLHRPEAIALTITRHTEGQDHDQTLWHDGLDDDFFTTLMRWIYTHS